MNLVLVERDPSPLKLDVMGVEDWPLRELGASRFECSYRTTETFYIISGRAVITPRDGGGPVHLQEGDLVTLLPGLDCTWDTHGSFSMHHRSG